MDLRGIAAQQRACAADPDESGLMARPSNADLIERVKELEAEVARLKADAPSDQPMAFRVRACLKDIIRDPGRAVYYAEQALRHL
jgi:hypothetical protein